MIRWFLLFILQAGIAAQPPQGTNYAELFNPVEIRKLLLSSNEQEQAWGAWLAAQGQRKDLIPLLQQIAEKRLVNAALYKPEPLLEAALDAMIQLSATVRPSLIPQIYAKRPIQALVLLSKLGAEANPLLLEWVARENDTAWFTAANMLLARRLPQTAPLFLRGLKITATLTVSDDGSVASSLIRVGTPLLRVIEEQPPGYPPLALYSMVEEDWPGNVVITNGPRSLYYMRSMTSADKSAESSEEGIRGPTSEDRLLYLYAMTGPKSTAPLHAMEYRSVAWHGKAALELEIKSFREDILASYSNLVHFLVQDNRLTAIEASSLPPLDIEIRIDDRHTEHD
jgi:hypothetical protein